MVAFTYTGGAPVGYACVKCGAAGCKLWRQYQTFANHIRLLCGVCALADQKEPGPIDDEGFHVGKGALRKSDAIGWLVPAVPTEDGETYWGYTTVPDAGVSWWRHLPTTARGVDR